MFLEFKDIIAIDGVQEIPCPGSSDSFGCWQSTSRSHRDLKGVNRAIASCTTPSIDVA